MSKPRKDSCREVRQSGALTLASYKPEPRKRRSGHQPRFTVTQMRLKYRIIEKLQYLFEGLSLGSDVDPESVCVKEDICLEMRIKDILTPKSKDYDEVRLASDELCRTLISNIKPNGSWCSFPFLTKSEGDPNTGVLRLRVNREFITLLVRQGVWQTFYDVETICSLSSTNAMRLYEIVSRQDRASHPLSFSYDELRDMLGIYQYEGRSNNFDARVLRPAISELNERAPYSFVFRKYKNDKGVLMYSIHPKYLPQNERNGSQLHRLQRQTAVSMVIPQSVRAVLKSPEGFGFTDREIHNNLDTFLTFQKIPGRSLIGTITETLDRLEGKSNPKGYLIARLQSIIKESDSR